MSESKNLDRPVEAWAFLPGNGLSIQIPTADGGMQWGERFGGLTKREHAAIALRVPESGDPDLDAMIRTAQRRDLAAMAMQGLYAEDAESYTFARVSSAAVQTADALLSAISHPVAEKEG